ncbi:MAG TPA: amidase family protein [Polyangiaceae bacterium]|nr:amidase family protein [Polyangiaceae bacterium]
MHPLDHIARLDGVAQAELVARGELSALESIDACQRRLELVNPLLRAVVTHDFDAARARARQGVTGPFAGVPFLFKDLCATAGLRCTFGSRLFARNVPAAGSAFSERLAAAGLISVGKSATSEFGLLGSTETLLEGVTHNPWRLTLSASGSSGGAAAAVAAGIVPLAHASDGGGSIRGPAASAGLFGLKPSRGRSVPSSATGSPFDALLSDGCISRSVRDTALFLSLVEADGELPRLGYVREPSGRRLRIGYTSTTLIGSEPEVDCLRALEATAALCRELGHSVEAAPAPDVDGRAVSLGFFTLAGGALAGMVEMLEPMLGRPVGADDLEPFTLELIASARATLARGVDVAALFATATRRYLDALAPYDLLLTPTYATRPWELGWLSPLEAREELIARTERAVCYTPIHNIVGSPAMSVPLYWTADHVPIGSHFAAAPGREDVLLGLAYELERARPWAERWAPFSFPRLAA